MKKLIYLLVLVVCLVGGAAAQSKTNDTIRQQIKRLAADKTFTLITTLVRVFRS